MFHTALLTVTSSRTLRTTPRTVNRFESTCVMKDIWSIKAYSFSVPFNWWVCGRAGRCPQALSALAAEGIQHTFIRTHTDPPNMLWQAILHKSLPNPSISCPHYQLACPWLQRGVGGDHFIHEWTNVWSVSHYPGLTVRWALFFHLSEWNYINAMHLISMAAQLQLEIITPVSLVLMLSHVAAEDVLVSLTSSMAEGIRMPHCWFACSVIHYRTPKRDTSDIISLIEGLRVADRHNSCSSTWKETLLYLLTIRLRLSGSNITKLTSPVKVTEGYCLVF